MPAALGGLGLLIQPAQNKLTQQELQDFPQEIIKRFREMHLLKEQLVNSWWCEYCQSQHDYTSFQRGKYRICPIEGEVQTGKVVSEDERRRYSFDWLRFQERLLKENTLRLLDVKVKGVLLAAEKKLGYLFLLLNSERNLPKLIERVHFELRRAEGQTFILNLAEGCELFQEEKRELDHLSVTIIALQELLENDLKLIPSPPDKLQVSYYKKKLYVGERQIELTEKETSIAHKLLRGNGAPVAVQALTHSNQSTVPKNLSTCVYELNRKIKAKTRFTENLFVSAGKGNGYKLNTNSYRIK